MGRLDNMDEQDRLDRKKREGLRFDKYEPCQCPNCNRVRVGKRNNGKRICEKCCWDVDAKAYDSDALSAS